jgi:hypothetical protein
MVKLTSWPYWVACLCLIPLLSFDSLESDELEPYYIFADKWVNGLPTGFMGEKNGKSILFSDTSSNKPYLGTKCIRIAVNQTEAWCGINIHFTGSWNVGLDESTPLADLSGYDYLEFYARAETRNRELYILPEAGVGGGGGFELKKYNDVFLEIGKEWKRHVIPLRGADVKRINTLFYFTLPKGDGVLYLDEIRFIKK